MGNYCAKFFFIVWAMVIASTFSISGCENKNDINEWTKDNLRGEVKSIIEISYEAAQRFGNIEKGDAIYLGKKSWVYNDNGNLIEEALYYSDDVYSLSTFKYDDSGNQVEKVKYELDGSLIAKWVYQYDSRGNRIEINLYHPDGSLEYRYISKFDDRGNEVEQFQYGLDGSLSPRYSFDYDTKGNVTEEKVYNPDGSIQQKWVYIYMIMKRRKRKL
jgi:hypothetical protein